MAPSEIHCPARIVPQVIPARSGSMVLTSTLQTGARFADCIHGAGLDARRHSSLLIFDAVFDGIFHRGFFNGDVVFLDFGCLRSFEDDFLRHWKHMALAVLDGNRRIFRTAFIDMSLPPNQLLVNRLQWALFSVLADLNADVLYRDHFRTAVEAPVERIPGLH